MFAVKYEGDYPWCVFGQDCHLGDDGVWSQSVLEFIGLWQNNGHYAQYCHEPTVANTDRGCRCRGHLVGRCHVMEHLLLADWQGGVRCGVPGIMVWHLRVWGVKTRGRRWILLSEDGMCRHRAAEDRRQWPYCWTRLHTLLQGEHIRPCLDSLFWLETEALVNVILCRVNGAQLFNLGGWLELKLVWSELAWATLDLVEELHWNRKYTGIGRLGLWSGLFSSPWIIILVGIAPACCPW